jgi:hypothetical protein
MRACASSADRYYYTPDAEGLGTIYRAIAYSFGCPPERFWGRRTAGTPH